MEKNSWLIAAVVQFLNFDKLLINGADHQNKQEA